MDALWRKKVATKAFCNAAHGAGSALEGAAFIISTAGYRLIQAVKAAGCTKYHLT
jgi:hypothetical protein